MGRVMVSEIIDTTLNSNDGSGYLGFIITFPDGRIENMILDYDRKSYDLIRDQIIQMRDETIHHYHLDR